MVNLVFSICMYINKMLDESYYDRAFCLDIMLQILL